MEQVPVFLLKFYKQGIKKMNGVMIFNSGLVIVTAIYFSVESVTNMIVNIFYYVSLAFSVVNNRTLHVSQDTTPFYFYPLILLSLFILCIVFCALHSKNKLW